MNKAMNGGGGRVSKTGKMLISNNTSEDEDLRKSNASGADDQESDGPEIEAQHLNKIFQGGRSGQGAEGGIKGKKGGIITQFFQKGEKFH